MNKKYLNIYKTLKILLSNHNKSHLIMNNLIQYVPKNILYFCIFDEIKENT